MAIYHLSVKTVSRSAGRCATAAAAYRAGVEIVDERTGVVHDYRRKGGVDRDHSPGLVLPAGAPAALADRSALWNAAEKSETRKNSTVAREFEGALPHELSAEQRGALVREFAQAVAKRHGIAVDAQIHEPGREGDSRNQHFHMLTSTRRLGPNGFGEKARELDDKKTGPALVTEWRATWAAMTNRALERAGSEARVDHRSLADQGIERGPTQHLGPQATGMERQGIATRIGDENRAVVIDFAERRALAAEVSELTGEARQIEGQLIELATERAKRAEAERYARMSSRELTAEIARLRPPRVDDLVRSHPDAVKAVKATELAATAWQAAAVAQRTAEGWRAAHPWRSRAQRAGLWRWAHVEELDATAAQAPALAVQYEDQALAERHTIAAVRQEIEISQLPVLAKLEALEQVRDQRAAQERAEARIEGGISAALKEIEAAAMSRRNRQHGWSDGGRNWEAVPRDLKQLVQAYNAADDAGKTALLDSYERIFRRDPAQAERAQQGLRGREHGRDMGMSR